MTIVKPSIPGGMRDFSPSEVANRNFIFQTIRSVFERCGYQPIETPALENMETLTGKYGGEGEKLLYKIRGGRDPQDSDDAMEKKGLRYDLTVPFARYVVQHRHEIHFPFKRYQIQPVWRADRPQKSRYREFWQCDADVIGSVSLLNEVELILMIDEVFEKLNIPVFIKINHRTILKGIVEYWGVKDKFNDFVIELDKKDKIGYEGVIKNLEEKSITPITPIKMITQIKTKTQMLGEFFEDISGSLQKVKETFEKSEKNISQDGFAGIMDLQYIFETLKQLNPSAGGKIQFDASLARGLEYYTGTVIEVIPSGGVTKSSICAGGRYDDLTSVFGLPGISGVGISFGADRIYDVMEEKNLFPTAAVEKCVHILFVNFGEQEALYCLKVITEIRNAGIAAELYPDAVKIKKQMEYADKRKIRYVGIVGEEELKQGKVKLKDMNSGEQQDVVVRELIERIKE